MAHRTLVGKPRRRGGLTGRTGGWAGTSRQRSRGQPAVRRRGAACARLRLNPQPPSLVPRPSVRRAVHRVGGWRPCARRSKTNVPNGHQNRTIAASATRSESAFIIGTSRNGPPGCPPFDACVSSVPVFFMGCEANPADGTGFPPPSCSFGWPAESKGHAVSPRADSQPGLRGAFRLLAALLPAQTTKPAEQGWRALGRTGRGLLVPQPDG
jgi:hypothetical protein